MPQPTALLLAYDKNTDPKVTGSNPSNTMGGTVKVKFIGHFLEIIFWETNPKIYHNFMPSWPDKASRRGSNL